MTTQRLHFVKSVILMKDRPPYSKNFPDYYTRKIHFVYEKVGIDFHVVVQVIEATSIMDSITGKIETQARFLAMRFAIAKLLAFITTTFGSPFLRLLLRQIINSHQIKMTFRCSKSNGSQNGYHYQGKFETLGSNFRHETPSVFRPPKVRPKI